MAMDSLIAGTSEPRTTQSLTTDLKNLGIQKGMTLIVHSSLSSIGWVCGNESTVVQALLRTLGDEGTLVMPAHSSDYSDPARWVNPPVPEAWWQGIRDNMPPFDCQTTSSKGMGKIAECFRTWPGTQRSQHPATSFCARGHNAERILRNHSLDISLGEDSPLGELYKLDAQILLLGVGHLSNTSLHLAEYRSGIRSQRKEGASILRNGERVWAWYSDIEYESAEFPKIGHHFENSRQRSFSRASIGSADSRLLPMRELVDYATNLFGTDV